MKISGDNPIRGINIYKNKAERLKTEGEKVSPKDSVEFSSLSKEMASLGEKVLSPGDVRSKKVDELKKRVDAGEYNVDSEALADKIVDEFLAYADKRSK